MANHNIVDALFVALFVALLLDFSSVDTVRLQCKGYTHTRRPDVVWTYTFFGIMMMRVFWFIKMMRRRRMNHDGGVSEDVKTLIELGLWEIINAHPRLIF